MLFQVIDIDTRQHANAEQPPIFGQPTTVFFGMQVIENREMTFMTPTPREQRPLPRQEVIESLERSLREHGDIWAELAKH
jgi:hypothetical protein